MTKVFHLELKAKGSHKYYGSLAALCKHNVLGVSKFTLDRYDFESKHYENAVCVIRRGVLITTGNG